MTRFRERKIIEIDADKCNGCGACVDACHEGAIQLLDGKARLVSDVYCDGLGDCLGPCPTGALTLVTRSAEAYDEEAVARRRAERKAEGLPDASRKKTGGWPGPGAQTPEVAPLPCGCPGRMSRSLRPNGAPDETTPTAAVGRSELLNWPVQLRLVPPEASYLRGADLLLAADCVGFAAPDFHRRYLKDKPLLIACPKLEDNEPQIAKLAAILEIARPASLTVLRMEVPCCGGLTRIAEAARARSGRDLPLATRVVAIDGAEQP